MGGSDISKGWQIVLKSSDMAIPIDTSDYRLLKVLTAYCETVLKEHGTQQAAYPVVPGSPKYGMAT